MSPRKAAALRHGGELTLREHLIATAARLMGERGTVGLTVRAIAREAGVAGGVLYNHFTDKEELLAAALRAHVQAVERTFPPLPEPGAGTVEAGLRVHIEHGLAMHRAILPAFTGLLAQPEVLARFAGGPDGSSGPDGSDEQWRDRLAAYLHAEVELGRLAPGARVDAAASMIVGVCHEAVLSVLLWGPAAGAPPAPDVDGLVTALLDGLRP